MKTNLTAKSVKDLAPKSKMYKVWDTEVPGFFLRVMPSGTKTYAIHYRHNGQGRDFTLGRHGVITPAIARKLAISNLGDVARGLDVQAEKKKLSRTAERSKYDTLGGFIEHKYADWVKTERKTGSDTLRIIERDFKHLFPKKLSNVNSWDLTKWRTDRLNGRNGRALTKASVNRRLMALKAVLSKAVEWEVIEENPLKNVKPLKLDDDKRVRYLSEFEEAAFRDALDRRQAVMVADRISANKWRLSRKKSELEDLSARTYVDHLKPICILAMNTGMRRGEIFQLEWGSVDFSLKQIKVKAMSAKSGKSRDIPLNAEAFQTLIAWRNETSSTGLVFPSPITNQALDNIKRSWSRLITRAGINDLRFHDLRHHFASKLVMAGVDLNTVRELLGHSSIDMTLRYAHLAPEHKAAAVALLDTGDSDAKPTG